MRSWIVWLLICFSSAAWAGKPRIAILGLEVTGNSATVDSESTRVAGDFTVSLRIRPKAGKGPYEWMPGSEKELLDEKAFANCENEATDCMAAIGRKLGSDVLMYGKIERKQLGGQAGYQVAIKLLDVNKKVQLQGWTEFIPLSEASGIKLQEWARKGYNRLTNDVEGGTLVIVVKNVERGTILIDGEERANVTNNRGEVASLPEGTYDVSVVATGYQRWNSADKITIRNGGITTEEVTLVAVKAEAPICDPKVSNCDPPLANSGKRGRGCAGCGAGGEPPMIAAFALLLLRRRRRA